jgi:hypothetical protein
VCYDAHRSIGDYGIEVPQAAIAECRERIKLAGERAAADDHKKMVLQSAKKYQTFVRQSRDFDTHMGRAIAMGEHARSTAGHCAGFWCAGPTALRPFLAATSETISRSTKK